MRDSLISFIAGVLLMSCSHGQKKGESVKFQQYFVEGEQLYITHCSNCHQKNGKGLGLLYPPLDQSDYMDENFEEVICLIKNGKSGELQVNGKRFNQPMPGVATLTNLEIAEIATYIYNSWDHNEGIIDLKLVTNTLAECDENKVLSP
jgi:mono/diheme cytochrome c family protein